MDHAATSALKNGHLAFHLGRVHWADRDARFAMKVKILHEDRPNGVVAFERVEGLERVVTVINAGQSSWQEGEYGCWVGGGSFREVFSSQVGHRCRCMVHRGCSALSVMRCA